MPGTRSERVGDQIRREVARLLQFEVHDARCGFLTVTGVDVSADLGHARIFVSILPSGRAPEEVMKGLAAARGFIRSRLARTLRLKRMPEIAFHLDTSMERGARIEDLLREAHSPAHEEEGGEEEP